MRDIVIGCDSGTHAVKAVAMTLSGRLAAAAIGPNPRVRATADGGAEQDAPALRRVLERVLGEVVRQVGQRRIAAVAMTTQRDCLVPLNGARPIRPMFSWMDRRSLPASAVPARYRTPARERLYRQSRARWMARHEPRLLDTVTRWATLGSFLHLTLCDRYVDSSAALPSSLPIERWIPAWSADDRQWRAAGVRPAQVPLTVDAGAIVGGITRLAAARTGLAAGTPVAATGGDKNCEILCSMTLSVSSAALSLGTALSVGVTVANSAPFRQPPLWTTAAPIHGWWTVEAGVPAGLSSLDWVTAVRGFAAGRVPHAVAPPTRDGLVVVPFWLGHVEQPEAGGLIAGLRPSHDAGALRLAALEGLALESRRSIEAIERAGGQPIQDVRLVGGGAGDPLLCTVIAAVLNRRVWVAADALAGARAAAAVASLAVRPGPLDRLRDFRGASARVPVDAALARTYAAAYEHAYLPRVRAALSSAPD